MDVPAGSHPLSVLLEAENAQESDGTGLYRRFLARL